MEDDEKYGNGIMMSPMNNNWIALTEDSVTHKRSPATPLTTAKRRKLDPDETAIEGAKDEDGSEEEEDNSEEESEEEESGEEEGETDESQIESQPEQGTAEGNVQAQQRRTSLEVNLSSAPSVARTTPFLVEPTRNDVLLHPRHGREFRQFSGNMKLNFLIQQERAKYLSSDHATRALMIKGVVGLMRQLDPPGRFLKYRGENNWIEVTDEYAFMQVVQMFIGPPPQEENPAVAYAGNAGGQGHGG